ncbi:MAG TPA: VOC family protein [Coriobacteriia bacterium]|nr:VOC family protein [Coriobacteriia bacterium]
MNPVIHFEMPVEDADRVRRFYEGAFGWETTPLGPEAGDFVLAFTTETDENRVPKKVGAINGGFYKRTDPVQQVRLTILVDDIREAMEKVEKAGGTVLGGTMNPGEPDEMPGVGLFATFIDTEGNLATLYQDYALKTLPDAPGA